MIHSGDIHMTFRGHSHDIQETFNSILKFFGLSLDIQVTFRRHSNYIQVTLIKHSDLILLRYSEIYGQENHQDGQDNQQYGQDSYQDGQKSQQDGHQDGQGSQRDS